MSSVSVLSKIWIENCLKERRRRNNGSLCDDDKPNHIFITNCEYTGALCFFFFRLIFLLLLAEVELEQRISKGWVFVLSCSKLNCVKACSGWIVYIIKEKCWSDHFPDNKTFIYINKTFLEGKNGKRFLSIYTPSPPTFWQLSWMGREYIQTRNP